MNSKVAGIIVAFVLLLSVVGTAQLDGGRGGEAGQPIAVEIPAGSSSFQIGQILEEAGVIKNAWVFRAYARLAGIDGTLKAGHYQFTPGISLRELLRELVQGRPVTVMVTITEGQTLEEMAQTLSQAGIVSAAEFLRVSYDPGFALGEDMPEWLAGAKNLEGFLFPDTYRFAPNQSAGEIIKMMFKRFQEVTSELQQTPYVREFGIQEWVTLASIVEREGQLSSEFPIIASVFRNRLNRGMLLQSCATIQYVLDERKAVLSDEDLQIDSAFNTYQNPGLPPTPIGSPGMAALKAAANPAETSYLYFVAKGDGSHAFSRTYRDHLLAKRQAEKGL